MVSVATEPQTALSQSLHRRLLRTSPLYFGHTFLRGPAWEPFNGRYLVGPHHHKWQEIVCTQLNFAVVAARGTGKSKFFAFLWLLWLASMHAGQQFLLISSTDENCKKLLREIREEIETNPALQWLYPAGKVSKIWRSHDLSLSNGFSIVARSALSRIRGYHPNFILCDDAITDEAATSEAYRKKFRDFFFGVLGNMLMRGGVLGICGTPLSHKDLLCKDLKENPVYTHDVFPVLNAKQESIWAEVIPLSEIEKKKRGQPSIQFSREMLCKPVSSDVSLFPRSLFAGHPVEQSLLVMGLEKEAYIKSGLRLYQGVDLAFSGRAGADYFVIMTVGVDGLGNRWICDIHRSRGKTFREQLSTITRLGHKYRPEVLCIEANAAQKVYSQEMKEQTDLNIYEWVTGTEKHSFDKGLPSLQLLAESKKYRMPRGDADSREKTDILMDELESFAHLDGKCVSLGEHDDVAMSLLLAEHAIRRGTMWQSVLLGADDKPAYVHANAREEPKQAPKMHHEIMADIRRLQGL